MSFKNLSLGNYTVTVSTDRMYQKASELETLVEKLDSALTQAAEIVKRTDSYWVGDAAEIVRTEAREGVKLAENNHKNLTREIENLRLITEQYHSAEKKNSEDSSQLPSSILT
ncbi:WXG100 family type VII secretion target [Ruminococcoides intestinale]|uniref:WXG100 family type VII secretion target n=1 Tax=Ruminococcoides intestinale TaxID=3133162 RepID=UPI0032D378CF